jgi:hypothetical protein
MQNRLLAFILAGIIVELYYAALGDAIYALYANVMAMLTLIGYVHVLFHARNAKEWLEDHK